MNLDQLNREPVSGIPVDRYLGNLSTKVRKTESGPKTICKECFSLKGNDFRIIIREFTDDYTKCSPAIILDEDELFELLGILDDLEIISPSHDHLLNLLESSEDSEDYDIPDEEEYRGPYVKG